jgi:hypothetical protein
VSDIGSLPWRDCSIVNVIRSRSVRFSEIKVSAVFTFILFRPLAKRHFVASTRCHPVQASIPTWNAAALRTCRGASSPIEVLLVSFRDFTYETFATEDEASFPNRLYFRENASKSAQNDLF